MLKNMPSPLDEYPWDVISADVTSTKSNNASDVTSVESNTADVTLTKGNTWPAGLAMPSSPADAIETGAVLIALKSQMPGTFKAWVTDRCPFSYMTATRWMKAARGEPVRGCELHTDAENSLCEGSTSPVRNRGSQSIDYIVNMPSFPVDEFRPTRTNVGLPAMTKDEFWQLIGIACGGLPSGDFPEASDRLLPNLFAVMVAASASPTATYRDLWDVALHAKIFLESAAHQMDELIELARKMPGEGLVSSSPIGAGG